MPKVSGKKKTVRHDPLHKQILDSEALPVKHWRQKKDEEEEKDDVVPEALSKRILSAAQKQQEEDDMIMDAPFDDCASMASLDIALDLDDEEPDEDGYVFSGVVDPEEEKAMAQFLPSASSEQKGNSLADVILAAIAKKEQQEQKVEGPQHGISPRVVQIYTEIGKWLKNFRSGKLPKAFKIIPNLSNWEQILYLTNPIDWSPNAMREATKIFAANLNPKMAQRFYNLVLLPAVREDIADNGRLNFHYYEALKKALFKPSAWIKGILLPLAEQNCTVREAVIIASVLSKISVPVMHASAGLIKLSQMQPWYGTTSILMMTLIGKKYALPYRVITEVVEHFLRFIDDNRVLPLIWHRCLLTLVQKYKYDITKAQKERLKELMRTHAHDIGHEIRRELFSAPPKELRAAADAMVIG